MIKIVDNFYQDTDLLDELYTYFYYSGSWQFDYFPNNYVWKNKQSTEIETKICTLIRRICVTDPTFGGNGYEPWVNVLTRDIDHQNHHVDCDEEAEGIEPSKMTAILYLGSEEGLEGGQLALDTTEYSPQAGFYEDIYELEKNMDSNWIKIPYKYNRLVLYTGNFPHAVLPITSIKKGDARVALIISSWDKKIKVQR
jgi:hypothetical protein|tara:strand:+ start:711 stop:1301 length:591 start_codon:yes stop_codon:yes gene_type:complete